MHTYNINSIQLFSYIYIYIYIYIYQLYQFIYQFNFVSISYILIGECFWFEGKILYKILYERQPLLQLQNLFICHYVKEISCILVVCLHDFSCVEKQPSPNFRCYVKFLNMCLRAEFWFYEATLTWTYKEYFYQILWTWFCYLWNLKLLKSNTATGL